MPYWQGGDLHQYGAWWLVDELERARPGFVRRLLALAATRGDDDPDGLRLAARAYGGRAALAAAFARFGRMALGDPLVGPALRARRTAKLQPGGRIVLRGSVPPLGLRLWRVPATARAVTIVRTDAPGPAVVVRRGSAERVLVRGSLRLQGGRGALLVLVAGGAGGRAGRSPRSHRLSL